MTLKVDINIFTTIYSKNIIQMIIKIFRLKYKLTN